MLEVDWATSDQEEEQEEQQQEEQQDPVPLVI